MNGREKVLAALEYRNEGRVPVTLAPINTVTLHGCDFLKMLCSYPCDFYDLSERKYPTMEELESNRRKIDKWGCVWETADVLITGAVIDHPLKDVAEVGTFKIPEVKQITHKEIENAERTRERFPVWGSVDQFFQVMQNIRGSEELLVDLYMNPESIQLLIKRMLNEYHLPALEELLKLRPDIIGLGDDWGTQNQLMISPKMWRELFKPVYKKMIDLCHEGGAKVFFHTCGYTIDILEDFIELGLDIINPQITIMDVDKYGKISRGKITVMPDLNRQGILVNGTPEQVKEHVIQIYSHLGTSNGGLIAYVPIEHSMPVDNITAMLDVACNYIP